jgi:hypothetical protein
MSGGRSEVSGEQGMKMKYVLPPSHRVRLPLWPPWPAMVGDRGGPAINRTLGQSGSRKRSGSTMEQDMVLHPISLRLGEERDMAARHHRRNHGGGIPFPRSPAATRASR